VGRLILSLKKIGSLLGNIILQQYFLTLGTNSNKILRNCALQEVKILTMDFDLRDASLYDATFDMTKNEI
jgi:hypothetical protein